MLSRHTRGPRVHWCITTHHEAGVRERRFAPGQKKP